MTIYRGPGGTGEATTDSDVTEVREIAVQAAASATAAASSAASAANASRLTAGTVTTGSPGTSASAAITGDAGSQILNLTVPRGDVGAAGTAGASATVAVGTVTTGAANTSAVITNSGTSSAAVFNFTIPRGETGATGTGAGNVTGPTSSTNNSVALFNGTTGTIIKDSVSLNFDGTNFGVGVVPGVWNIGNTVIQNGINGSFWHGGASTTLGTNARFQSGWKYVVTGNAAARYLQSSTGTHEWYIAPSGTAGNAISFTQAMTLDASGNLGIGTSSPGTKLDVSGAARVQGNFFVYGGGDRLNVFPQTAGSGVNLLVTDNANSTYAPLNLEGSLQTFNIGGSEGMRLTNAGLGIGTSSPTSLLHLGTNNPELRFDDTDANGVVLCRHSASAFLITIDPTNVDVSSNLQIRIDDVEQARLTSTGLGIGTSSPSDKLEIGGAGAGIILASPNGTRYRVTVSNLGVLTVAAV
jgi:hypothetical protein